MRRIYIKQNLNFGFFPIHDKDLLIFILTYVLISRPIELKNNCAHSNKVTELIPNVYSIFLKRKSAFYIGMLKPAMF